MEAGKKRTNTLEAPPEGSEVQEQRETADSLLQLSKQTEPIKIVPAHPAEPTKKKRPAPTDAQIASLEKGRQIRMEKIQERRVQELNQIIKQNPSLNQVMPKDAPSANSISNTQQSTEGGSTTASSRSQVPVHKNTSPETEPPTTRNSSQSVPKNKSSSKLKRDKQKNETPPESEDEDDPSDEEEESESEEEVLPKKITRTKHVHKKSKGPPPDRVQPIMRRGPAIRFI